ncbi:MAG: hypothetical protein J5I65_05625 [Aridibacter famidurans]|nr:hypothetical protein [Aridibacter famidurans]
MRKTITALILGLLLVANPILAQEKTEAFLVDEFGPIACGDGMARIDLFFTYIQNNEESTGLVIIRSPKDNFRYPLSIESLLYGEIEFHKDDDKLDIDLSDLKVIRIEDAERTETSYWIVPKGASLPEEASDTPHFSLELPDGTKPFKFLTNDYSGPCNWGGTNIHFQEMLNANPLATGNLVIADENQKAFQEKKGELLSALSGIDPARLRFFFVKSKIPYVEYWIVPKKAD